jgi:hypothetical protein
LKVFSVQNRSAAIFGLTVLVSIGLALIKAPALGETQTFKEEIAFDSVHPCTLEPVAGIGAVHLIITMTDNPDGSTHVRIYHHTSGMQGIGVVSGDRYVFNEGETTEADVSGSGTVYHRVEFIHMGESLGHPTEALDDFHQRVRVIVSEMSPPVVTQDRSECR